MTEDIEVQRVFNDAGFIVNGFVDQAPLPKLLGEFAPRFRRSASSSLWNHTIASRFASPDGPSRPANVECNATAAFAIAHHLLVSTRCIVFTSSVTGFIPTPFAASYAATKSFVSQLACSLHIEVQSLGIDVCAVHPSPVRIARRCVPCDARASSARQSVRADGHCWQELPQPETNPTHTRTHCRVDAYPSWAVAPRRLMGSLAIHVSWACAPHGRVRTPRALCGLVGRVHLEGGLRLVGRMGSAQCLSGG